MFVARQNKKPAAPVAPGQTIFRLTSGLHYEMFVKYVSYTLQFRHTFANTQIHIHVNTFNCPEHRI